MSPDESATTPSGLPPAPSLVKTRRTVQGRDIDAPRYRPAPVASPFVIDILGINSLFAEMIAGIGLAIVVGNGYALWRSRGGRRPDDVPGDLRKGRVLFLMAVGTMMTVWAVASLIA